MQTAGYTPTVANFNSLMSAHDGEQEWETVVDTFHCMGPKHGLEPNVASYAVAVRAEGKRGRWREAKALFDQAVRRGLEPNACCFSAAMSACDKAEQWALVLELFADLQRRGVAPNQYVYQAAMHALEKSGRWSEALEIWEGVLASATTRPTNRLVNSAIVAYTKGGLWEKAVALLGEMEQRGLKPDVYTYSAAITACDKGGRPEDALALFAAMEARGIAPNCITMNAVLCALVSSGNFQRAVDFFATFKGRVIKPNTNCYNTALRALAGLGRWDRALSMLDEMGVGDRAKPDPLSITFAIWTCRLSFQISCGRVHLDLRSTRTH